jgi:low molecular weight protein-tyrosine phosphatase
MVCTGNLCRSPMAEALMRHALERAGCSDIEVASSGTWAGSGHGATLEACTVLEGRGIDLTPHRSTPLSEEALRRADLVVAMTSVHLREIEGLVAGTRTKTLLMKEIAELKEPKLGDGASLEDRLDLVLRAKRPEYRRALDLDDPIGLPLFAYERCASDIETGVDRLVSLLCGATNPPDKT